MSHLTSAASLLMSLTEAGNRVSRRLDHTLAIHGISFTEFRVLHHLAQAPGETMRRVDLAETVGLTASGVTRLLNPMEKIHLVEKERNPRDARVSLVRLSAAGKEIYGDALASFCQRAQDLAVGLPGERMAELGEQLNSLA
ncbi:MAG: MarR family winged helix-turn-helix transcriptional regulator [Pseudomonadota bacterium]